MTLLIDADFSGPAGTSILGRNAAVDGHIAWEGDGVGPVVDGAGNLTQALDAGDASLSLPSSLLSAPFVVSFRVADAGSSVGANNAFNFSGLFDLFLMFGNAAGSLSVGGWGLDLSIIDNAAGRQIWLVCDPIEYYVTLGVGETPGNPDDVLTSAYVGWPFDVANFGMTVHGMGDAISPMKLSAFKIDGAGTLNNPEFWTAFRGTLEVR